jgi:uncharacterized phage infection (PIP) family protein YhgE
MMDQIISTLSSVSSNDTAQLQGIQSQFNQLRAGSVGIAAALSASVNEGVEAIEKSNKVEQEKVEQAVVDTNDQSVAGMMSVASRLSAAIAALKAGNETEFESQQQDNDDALELARFLANLGSTAQSEVEDIIAHIQSGQLSLNDYLSSQAALTSAQINTAEDLIVAFSAAMQSNVDKVKRVYDSETDKLQAYGDTVKGAVGSYEDSRQKALASLSDLVDEAQTTATSFDKTSNDTINDATALLDEAQDKLTLVSGGIPNKLSGIRASIVAAVDEVEQAQDTMAKSLIDKATAARDTIVANVASFGTQHDAKDYVYQVGQVSIPTVPPELLVDFKY